jgi:hypothetical protein
MANGLQLSAVPKFAHCCRLGSGGGGGGGGAAAAAMQQRRGSDWSDLKAAGK